MQENQCKGDFLEYILPKGSGILSKGSGNIYKGPGIFNKESGQSYKNSGGFGEESGHSYKNSGGFGEESGHSFNGSGTFSKGSDHLGSSELLHRRSAILDEGLESSTNKVWTR